MGQIFIKLEQKDKRYRVLVNLVRADRPRYWHFKCSNCGANIAELQGYEVYGYTDFYDSASAKNAAVGRHCKGTDERGLPCQYSYYFVLS